MRIYAGSSNLTLAKKIAGQLKAKMGQVELSRFANGEARVWIKDRQVGKRVVVVQSFSSPPDEHIMEFCLLVDALKRKGAKTIVAVIPWMGYCIQDRVFRSGEPLSSKVIAKIIETAKLNNILSLDLHNQTIEGFFDTPFKELFTTNIIIDFLKTKPVKIDLVVSPDVGAVKKAAIFAQEFSQPLVTINKERNLKTGQTSIIGVNGKIAGKNALIVDDFVSTGGTLMQTAKYLKKQGVKQVYASVVHHFYAPGTQEKLEKSQLDRVYVTDTIDKPENKKWPKLKIISVAELISREIKNI